MQQKPLGGLALPRPAGVPRLLSWISDGPFVAGEGRTGRAEKTRRGGKEKRGEGGKKKREKRSEGK